MQKDVLKKSFVFCSVKRNTELGFPANLCSFLFIYFFIYLSLHHSPLLTGHLFSRWHSIWQIIGPRLRSPTAFMTRPSISRRPSSTSIACFLHLPHQVPPPYTVPLSCNLEHLWPPSITAGIYIIPRCL